ncbi:uncharacterized protein LOC124660844 [Lolium rigidum]|uniref:uncharacterized protein LOC124660844 n=1 Tax=Lolium rigidum TaxID=89674 RepID=UPI001F5D40CE|nr:uncharacterized protein LOC124660844 [Lolium rigidum]
MDAAVSLHHHGALPAAATSSLPPHHQQHRSLHLKHPLPTISTRLTTTLPPSRTPRRSSTSTTAPPPVPARAATTISSARAATGYAAALADASLRAGTLPRAARHASALLRRLQDPPRGQRLEEADGRVSALVRMLVGKGKGGMVADVLAEFAAICDRLLAPPPNSASSKRAHSRASYSY